MGMGAIVHKKLQVFPKQFYAGHNMREMLVWLADKGICICILNIKHRTYAHSS